jgi:hypothetical protein
MRTFKLEEKLKIRNSSINIENERMGVDMSFPSLHPLSNSIILPASARLSSDFVILCVIKFLFDNELYFFLGPRLCLSFIYFFYNKLM